MKYFVLIFIALITFAVSDAQDTLRYSHTFKLPVKISRSAYEKKITQHSSDVHNFIFNVYDSGTVNIIVRSEYDSLDIRMGDVKIRKASKSNGIIMYTGSKCIYMGKQTVTIRTPKYCSYTFVAFGN